MIANQPKFGRAQMWTRGRKTRVFALGDPGRSVALLVFRGLFPGGGWYLAEVRRPLHDK